MRMIAAVLALGLLAACGADGAPLRPVSPPDVTFTTQASVGVRL
jgi:hypothetical protein